MTSILELKKKVNFGVNCGGARFGGTALFMGQCLWSTLFQSEIGFMGNGLTWNSKRQSQQVGKTDSCITSCHRNFTIDEVEPDTTPTQTPTWRLTFHHYEGYCCILCIVNTLDAYVDELGNKFVTNELVPMHIHNNCNLRMPRQTEAS